MATCQPPPISPIRFSQRHLDVCEEDLVELRVPGDLSQRAHLDPGCMHVDDHVGQPVVTLRAGVGAGEQDAEVGHVRVRGPHLLPVEHEPVLLDAATRPDTGEIGSRLGLGEALAPDLVPGEEWRQVARLLLLGPVGDDRRAGHAEPDHAHVRRRLGTRQLLEQDRLVRDRRARAAVLLRPRQPGVTGGVEGTAPGTHRGEVVRLQAEAVPAQLLGDVVGEPGA